MQGTVAHQTIPKDHHLRKQGTQVKCFFKYAFSTAREKQILQTAKIKSATAMVASNSRIYVWSY